MRTRRTLKIRPIDTEWTLPSRIDRNPATWMIRVNGFVLDAWHARREIREASHKG